MKKSSEQTLAATPVPALQDATDWATGVTTERPKIVKAWPRARAMIAWAWVLLLAFAAEGRAAADGVAEILATGPG